MSLVESLVESLRQMQQERGWERVTKVHLKVGALRQVVPEVLLFCYEVAVSDTELAGSSLELDVVPIRRRCTACGRIWGGEEGAFALCPSCGGTKTELLEGMELYIDSLEVEEKDAT